MFGLIVVIIGMLMLLQTMGLIPGSFWDYVWPIIIILFGLSILKKKNGWNCCQSKKHDSHKVVDEQ